MTGVLEQDPCVRTATFDVDGSSQCFEVVVMQREMMESNRTYEGPLVIEQSDTTTLVVPLQTAELDAQGNIIIRDK